MKGFKFQDFKQVQWIVLFFVPCFLLAQEENKDVEILNADLLKFTEINGKKFTKLIGNVQLEQDEVFLFCDSALLDKDSNTLIAWHHIHIQQDSTHAYSTFLTYNGNTKLATLTNGVKLTDNKASIFISSPGISYRIWYHPPDYAVDTESFYRPDRLYRLEHRF